MKYRGHNSKRDANETEIVRAMEKVGAHVTRMDKPVDLLVSYRGKWFVVEVKTPKGKLTDDQVDFIADSRADVFVVTDAETAINIISQNAKI